jgi:hypothetical protein
MTIDEHGDGTIVVTYDSIRLTWLMLAATAILLAVAGYDVFLGTRGLDRIVGLLGAAVTCLIVAIVFLERAWFEFSPATRIVTWRRRWGLRTHSGSLPFGSIELVTVERPIGDDGTPSRRIVLKTKEAQDIPITVGYRPDADGATLEIVSRIRELLGHDTDAMHVNAVRALIGAGKTIDAMRVLRESEGLSLAEAKRRVEELSASRS